MKNEWTYWFNCVEEKCLFLLFDVWTSPLLIHTLTIKHFKPTSAINYRIYFTFTKTLIILIEFSLPLDDKHSPKYLIGNSLSVNFLLNSSLYFTWSLTPATNFSISNKWLFSDSIKKDRWHGLKKSSIFTRQGMQTIYKNSTVENCT